MALLLNADGELIKVRPNTLRPNCQVAIELVEMKNIMHGVLNPALFLRALDKELLKVRLYKAPVATYPNNATD